MQKDVVLKSLVKWSEVKLLSRVGLFGTPWTVAYQAPPSMELSRHEDWRGWPFPSPGYRSWPKDRTRVSCIAGRRFYLWATREAHNSMLSEVG